MLVFRFVTLFCQAVSFGFCLDLFYSCVFGPFGVAVASLGDVRTNICGFFLCVCSLCAGLVLSVSSSSSCLGWTVAWDCGTPWAFFLPFLV